MLLSAFLVLVSAGFFVLAAAAYRHQRERHHPGAPRCVAYIRTIPALRRKALRQAWQDLHDVEQDNGLDPTPHGMASARIGRGRGTGVIRGWK